MTEARPQAARKETRGFFMVCLCGCGRQFISSGLGRPRYFFNASCRKRVQRGTIVSGRLALRGQFWLSILDGDKLAFELFKNHYSFSFGRADNRKTDRFVGVGQHLVLALADYSGLFVWRLSSRRWDSQEGLCCSIFRNESSVLSSSLILDAENLAALYWPNVKRFFTFVHAGKILSSNPGYCFKCAGWSALPFVTGHRGLVVLEKIIS